ncbi:SpoIIE family protein phosphatase [Kutzneria kofuensis]|uniref:Anti-sigma regulatory factor (Ser/Thr protein kinase)/putative methionine-R-sulfoxide reductase with GAF domain n=1 Tax=Kutzneria kofuensis TaxID=103725 RepID=A0A7W9NLS8_9PSEU|nr:SpoIIE family protein phosphatase [Kutzneria kofuensis]MBB5897084.1 anti-sigma regulatory factor (Ser/Thr protein kinase)/putative methionine-R-sulfoxide reductase with GAF domain [Kutzneria kofuensis]
MSDADTPLRWHGLAKAEQLSGIRRSIEEWNERAGLSVDLSQMVALAMYEAMANVVEHAYRDDGIGTLDVELRRDRDAILGVVADEGHWHVSTPEEQHHRGRGLALIERLAAQVTVLPGNTGTKVRMRWPIERKEPDTDARLRFLDAVTDAGLARLSTEAVLRELLARIHDLLLVDTASVLTYDRSGDHLVATATVGLEQQILRPTRIAVGNGNSGGLASRVAQSQEPLIVDQIDHTTVETPLLWESGVTSLLGVPMVAAGTLVGVLRVGVTGERKFTDQDILLLRVAADRLALAVQAHSSNAESSATTALQRSLLPSRLPSVAGLDFAGRYAPGADLGVGGDWYDVFPLSGGRIGIVIGDVAGHGFPAAVVMGRLRSALRAYALDNEAPEVVLDKLDRKASHFEAGVMATVAYAVVEPTAGRLTLCLAGHLRPVLAMPGRPSEFVDAPVDPPIGFSLKGRHRRSHVVDVPPGATVCFYTDGLIERRDRPIDAGLAELLNAVAAVPSETVCAELMTEFVEGQPTADDVALLVVHRTEDG